MSLEIAWSSLAIARLQEIQAYIALDNPAAAERTGTRIAARVETLRQHPHLGRSGTEPGIRELIISGTPYIVLYRVGRNRVTITTIWHAAQRQQR